MNMEDYMFYPQVRERFLGRDYRPISLNEIDRFFIIRKSFDNPKFHHCIKRP